MIWRFVPRKQWWDTKLAREWVLEGKAMLKVGRHLGKPPPSMNAANDLDHLRW